mgnify:CR=1 FL=1
MQSAIVPIRRLVKTLLPLTLVIPNVFHLLSPLYLLQLRRRGRSKTLAVLGRLTMLMHPVTVGLPPLVPLILRVLLLTLPFAMVLPLLNNQLLIQFFYLLTVTLNLLLQTPYFLFQFPVLLKVLNLELLHFEARLLLTLP